MEWVMGVMVAIMIIGFLGFGHQRGMMGGHGKEEQKQEMIEHNHKKELSCPDCPAESEPEKKSIDDMKKDELLTE